jgi:tetratricopeptide (TPR) repeat protein
LFARYVEGARPDIAIAPAQHLWDPTVRRRLERPGLPSLQLVAASPERRATQARELLLTLMAASEERPVFVESWPESPRAADLGHVPWLGVSASQSPTLERDGAERRLAALEHAQFGPAGPQTSTARELWASAYEELGKAHLKLGAADAALRAFQRTLELTPERAVAHSNLGVALEQQGDLAGALRETRAALELEPDRATAWVNLARLMLRTSGREAALSVLSAAERNAVRDPRLADLRQSLSVSAAEPQ